MRDKIETACGSNDIAGLFLYSSSLQFLLTHFLQNLSTFEVLSE